MNTILYIILLVSAGVFGFYRGFAKEKRKRNGSH